MVVTAAFPNTEVDDEDGDENDDDDLSASSV